MKKYNIAQISFLIACGSALQLAETFIPFPIPIPGLRIGLANITTLIGLIIFGVPAGLEIAVFRPIVTSLTNGTFLSPILMLSFCGSIVSFAVMACFYSIIKKHKFFSIIGISIIGAVSHNVAEILLAYYWLIPHHAVLALAPLLILAAVIGGYFVGWSTNYVLDKIAEEKTNKIPLFEKPFQVENIKQLALKDKIKISTAFVMMLSTIFLKTITPYIVLICFVLLMIFIYKETMHLLNRPVRLWGLILFSFLIPIIFSPAGNDLLWQWWRIKITYTGIYQGSLFSLRLVFLIFISIWIGVAEPSKLSQELAWILSPLKYFHFSVDRIPRITSLSLSFIPVIWEKMTHVKPKTLKTVLDVMAAFFVGLEHNSVNPKNVQNGINTADPSILQ